MNAAAPLQSAAQTEANARERRRALAANARGARVGAPGALTQSSTHITGATGDSGPAANGFFAATARVTANVSARVSRLKGPITAVATVGAILGGLAGYYNTFLVVKGVALPPASSLPSGSSAISAGLTAGATAAARDAIAALSVVVLPFANQTGDETKTYIADALTSSITADLSRIRDAYVVPSNTAMRLRYQELTLQQQGAQTGARFVLTGSVSSNGTALRVNAQLSDSFSGTQLWSHQFEGSVNDLFALQDQVTIKIGNSIGPEMVVVAARDSEKRKSTPKVTDLLLRAQALRIKPQTFKVNQASAALLSEALALEPDNLRAKAALSGLLALQAVVYQDELGLDKAGQIALAQAAANLAKDVHEIDPKDPSVYLAIAMDAQLRGDFQAALVAQQRRLELDPNSAVAYNNVGDMYLRMGDAQSATNVLLKGLPLASPLRPPTESYGNLSEAAFLLGKPDEAIEWALKNAIGNPNSVNAFRRLALGYALKGDAAQAQTAAAQALRLNPKLRLNLQDDLPWPGKEKAYQEFVEKRLLPAARLAGIPP